MSAAVLRDPRPGDHGWVVERHAALYAGDWGFDATFEALVARIVADFIETDRPRGGRCFIAEVDGRRAGSVYMVPLDADTAKLRLLFVDPEARGHGVGGCLVDACMTAARAAGRRRMVLWTQAFLEPARALYASRGFVLTASEPNRAFGRDMISETWEAAL